MKIKVKDNLTSAVAKALADRSSKAEHITAWQIVKDTEQYVPMLNGSLNARTRVVGNTIIYEGPYARYLYYGKVMVFPEGTTGANRNPNNPHHKGEVKIVTSKPLKYTKDFHKNAGEAWLERSKAMNKKRWEKVAQDALDGKIK